MKKYLLTLLAAAISMAAVADDIPAFPGAEGHGRYVTGGRGGTVRHVTNLSGKDIEGSFRRAVGYANSIVVLMSQALSSLKQMLLLKITSPFLAKQHPHQVSPYAIGLFSRQ